MDNVSVLKVIDVLEKTLYFYQDPKKWTQTYPARDKDGHCCLGKDERAVSFSLDTVLSMFSKNKDYGAFEVRSFLTPYMRDKVYTLDNPTDVAIVVRFNNNSTYHEVIEMLKLGLSAAQDLKG